MREFPTVDRDRLQPSATTSQELMIKDLLSRILELMKDNIKDSIDNAKPVHTICIHLSQIKESFMKLI